MTFFCIRLPICMVRECAPVLCEQEEAKGLKPSLLTAMFPVGHFHTSQTQFRLFFLPQQVNARNRAPVLHLSGCCGRRSSFKESPSPSLVSNSLLLQLCPYYSRSRTTPRFGKTKHSFLLLFCQTPLSFRGIKKIVPSRLLISNRQKARRPLLAHRRTLQKSRPTNGRRTKLNS